MIKKPMATVLSVDGTPATWQHFSATVSLTLSGDSVLHNAVDATGTREFNIERTRSRDGNWVSSISFAKRRSPIPSNVDPRVQDDPTPRDVQRIDLIDGAPERQVTTGNGKVSAVSPRGFVDKYGDYPWATALGRIPDGVPGTPSSKVRSGPAVAGSKRTVGSPIPLVEVAKRAVALAEIESRYGKASGTVNGRTRYVRVAGDTASEILVDPKTAAVLEASHVIGSSKEFIRTTHEYSAINDSTYLRVGTTIERVAKGAKTPVSLTIRYTNIQLDNGRRR